MPDNNAFVHVTGEYGDDSGEIRIIDSHGEVVMWENAEWQEDPSLVFVIAHTIQEALLVGTTDLRERIGHQAPDYPGWPEGYDYRFWWRVQQRDGDHETTVEKLRQEWARKPDVYALTTSRTVLTDWWFGFRPGTLLSEVLSWLHLHLFVHYGIKNMVEFLEGEEAK